MPVPSTQPRQAYTDRAASEEARRSESVELFWDPQHFIDEAAPQAVRVARQDEIPAAHRLAEELVGMTLAPVSASVAAHARTKASVWVLDGHPPPEGHGGITGVLVNLPLTAAGEIAILLGRFSAHAPDPEHLCAPGDPVSAMYIWFTGGSDLRGKTAVMRTAFAWRDGAYGGLRAYSRAATGGGARGLASLRFAPLELSHPGMMFCDKRR